VTDYPGRAEGTGRPMRPTFSSEVVEETAVVVTVDGELDLDAADALRGALDRGEAEETPILRLDATGVSFLDSTALGVILASAQRMRDRGGRFELVCTTPSIRRILDMTLISRTVHLLP
jgi:anti-anti-sigma factor